LIGLEALRVFESDVYELLPAAKRILTRNAGHQLFNEIKQEVVDAGVAQILSHAPEFRRLAVKQMLELIFPPITRLYEGQNGVSRDEQAWLREARACHADLFDKYFTLVVAQNDLSQADLDRLVGMTKDRVAFVSECQALQDRGLLKTAFERLDAFKTEIPLDSMPALVRALCDLSDRFAEPAPGFELLPFDALTTAWRLVYFGLQHEKDCTKRFEVVYGAFKDSVGLLLPVDIVSLEERSKEREDRGHQFLLEESQLPALKEICIEKLRGAATGGVLRSHPRASELIFRWSWLTSLTEVRDWLDTQINDPEGGTWLLSLLMGRTSSNGKTRYYIKPSFVEKYADIAKLEKCIANVEEKDLPELQKIALREFRLALRRRGEGKPEIDGYRLSDEEE